MTTLLLILAVPTLILTAVTWMMYPAAILGEMRQRPRPLYGPHTKVSIIIPAYNEEVVLGACLRSILATGWRRLEVIVVDDGSTDATAAVAAPFTRDPRVTFLSKINGGKGSALNLGIAHATGEILIFVDADGLFTPTTIPQLLSGFRHPGVGAVCGNDQPVNITGPLTALLALMTHVGTGMTRRALALLGMLPIVAGNSGAFRADAVRRVGGFREDTLGEDLELTWRIHFAGWDVEFAPHALVLAEVPSTLSALWKQRVRWQRGLIQTARIHRSRLTSPWRRPIDAYLPINLFSLLVAPAFQVATLAGWAVAALCGAAPNWMNILVGAGLVVAFAVTVLSLVLDRAWRDLRLLPALPLWLPFSWMMSAATVCAIWLEMRGKASEWNKLERTGVHTVPLPPAAVERETM